MLLYLTSWGSTHRLNNGNKCLAKFYSKSNGRIEIFEKKIHGKEVSHDRVKPLLRLFGQGGGGGLYNFYISPVPVASPAWSSYVNLLGLTRGLTSSFWPRFKGWNRRRRSFSHKIRIIFLYSKISKKSRFWKSVPWERSYGCLKWVGQNGISKWIDRPGGFSSTYWSSCLTTALTCPLQI